MQVSKCKIECENCFKTTEYSRGDHAHYWDLRDSQGWQLVMAYGIKAICPKCIEDNSNKKNLMKSLTLRGVFNV